MAHSESVNYINKSVVIVFPNFDIYNDKECHIFGI